MSYNPYCPICNSCGEDGCCSATNCKFHPEGLYCGIYINEFKFSHLMYNTIMKEILDEIIKNDPEVAEKFNKIFDESYNLIYNK